MGNWGPHSADLPSKDGSSCSGDQRVKDQVAFNQGECTANIFPGE